MRQKGGKYFGISSEEVDRSLGEASIFNRESGDIEMDYSF